MSEFGYIKLYRKICDWEWYSDPNTFKVFVHLLLNANVQDKSFKGMIVKRGSVLTSVASISEKNGLSTQNVRTALKRLEKTGEITINSQTKFSVISMVNYDKYQPIQQTTNNQLTTTKNNNNIDSNESIKKEKYKKKESATRFVKPTVEDVRKYVAEQRYHIDPESFVDFYESKGWMVGKNPMKSWEATVRTWERSWKEKHPNDPSLKPKREEDEHYGIDFF